VKPTRLPETAVSVALSAGIAFALIVFYVTIWGLGHLNKTTHHGRKVQ
jgi:hypothetical protein